jgi:hypothetical protein
MPPHRQGSSASYGKNDRTSHGKVVIVLCLQDHNRRLPSSSLPNISRRRCSRSISRSRARCLAVRATPSCCVPSICYKLLQFSCLVCSADVCAISILFSPDAAAHPKVRRTTRTSTAVCPYVRSPHWEVSSDLIREGHMLLFYIKIN